MDFIKRIVRKVRPQKPGQNIQTSVPPKFETEEEYYQWVFTKNENWNTVTPNNDELLRWNGIKKFIESITSQHKTPLQILDLGCGRGWLSNLLTDYGSVTGVEPVLAVVKYANQLFPSINIINGDADTLIKNGFKGTFDLIVSSEVLEHIPEEQKDHFSSNINLLLKENGFAIISTPRKEAQEEYCKNSSLSQPVEEWLNEKDVENLFINNSFSVQDFMRLTRQTSETSTLDIYQLWLFKKCK